MSYSAVSSVMDPLDSLMSLASVAPGFYYFRLKAYDFNGNAVKLLVGHPKLPLAAHIAALHRLGEDADFLLGQAPAPAEGGG